MQVSWVQIAMVAIGGMAGSVLRFLIGLAFSRHSNTKIPWATFTVNIAGSFVIGLVLGYGVKKMQEGGHDQPGNLSLLLATGFCGGFTTFSAFCNEGLLLLKQNQFSLFFAYFTASVLFGLLATAAGYYLTK